MTLPTFTWAGWTATPKRRGWTITGPLPGLSIGVHSIGFPRSASDFLILDPGEHLIDVFLWKGRREVGHVEFSKARGADNTWVAGEAYLDENLRGQGLGALMYLAGHAALTATRSPAPRLISSAEHIGMAPGEPGGTSLEAQAVWDRLRGAGRMNRGRAAKTADFWPALHARNNGIFYRGVGPNALSKGKYIAALGRGLYVTWNEATARAFAGEGGTVIRYRLPLDLVLLDDQSRDMGVIKMRMGLDPWDVAGGPHYADIVRMQVQKLGYDGAISSDRFTGIVVYDLDRAEALDPVPKTPRPKRRPKTPKRPRRPKKPKIRRLKDLPNRGRAARGDPLWHITSRKSFKPSTEFRPITAGGMNRAREPMLYATRDPNYWHNVSGGGMGPWTRGRKWAAELELLPGHPPVARENPLRPQTQLDPAFVRVKRIIPVNEAIAEVTGWRDPGPGEGDGTGGSVWVGADYRYTPPAPKKKRGRGKASPANDFMDSYERFTEPHPYERHWRVWPNGIYTRLDKIAPWVLKDAVTLRVIVSPDERSKGEASRVLRHIARLADEHLVKVTLSAKPFTGIEDKLNQDDLVAWYGRHGWKRRKLHTFNQMIRVPDLLGGLFTKD